MFKTIDALLERLFRRVLDVTILITGWSNIRATKAALMAYLVAATLFVTLSPKSAGAMIIGCVIVLSVGLVCLMWLTILMRTETKSSDAKYVPFSAGFRPVMSTMVAISAVLELMLDAMSGQLHNVIGSAGLLFFVAAVYFEHDQRSGGKSVFSRVAEWLFPGASAATPVRTENG